MITKGFYTVKAALNKGENPLPHFRDKNHDLTVITRAPFPKEYAKNLGQNCGKRVLPYYIQDRYDRTLTITDIPSILLENQYLKATVLPTLGGRLISLYDKTEQKELLFNTSTIQTANLANRDAWFAGGIEWNFGQYGHAFSSNSPVYCAKQVDAEGNEFLRLYEFERCIGVYWKIDLHLKDRFLYAHMAVHNLSTSDTSLYYWTNVALKQTKKTRVFASEGEVIYIDPFVPKGMKGYGFGELPYLEILSDTDVSYPANFPYSNEYFFTCDHSQVPWEATIQEDGSSFFDASTANLAFRKMFCWGNGWGGKHWQEYLSPEGGEYFEAQAGLAPSQLHGLTLPKQTTYTWTQCFGSLGNKAKIEQVKAIESWKEARDTIQTVLTSLVDRNKLKQYESIFEKESEKATGELLCIGSGWGYLENLRAQTPLPKGMRFIPEADLQVWENFIHTGILETKAKPSLPFSCPPLTWYPLLKDSPSAAYYAGILALELEQEDEAEKYWKNKSDGFSLRNLAILEVRRGNSKEALQLYRLASKSKEYNLDRAIAEEFIRLLVKEQFFQEAKLAYEQLPEAWKTESDSLAIDQAWIACHEQDAQTLGEILLRPWHAVREGETPFKELWFEWKAILYSKEHNQILDDSIREKIMNELTLPQKFDFNMVM
ncbi:hypothetical protein SpiGrapes_1514 [Sphaerochaeta pleomorpha str. Grapes]|uniref:DUF5107 domain-containing protein n=1 Tax=Sphaerochaeta pleomorpha (strain ATCC BAA-1885 / DSM 22778 / Grapes) TaxID=158190 RepID=G8QVN2_SPHPG|nr:DUF5107 domain-containing protein [Sphaerochaeta pleomorpha]AEV29324.1 hypothetical protein SpiGrapes_1514 [Sphaerochaeta pleomorpha str. Grapes]